MAIRRDPARSPRRPSSRPSSFALALVLLSALAVRPALPSFDGEPPRVQASVDVTVLDLDVVATKDGRSVTDLRRDEIVVRIGGRVLPVDLFARIAGAQISQVPTAPGPAPEAGDVTVVPRQFLFYFDDARLLPWQRRPVIDGLRAFVDRFGPTDEASIVSYDGSTNVLVPFTSSREALLDGLSRLEEILPRGLAREREFRTAASAVEQEARLQTGRSGRGAPSDLRATIVRNYSEQERVRSRSSLADLARTISALAGRPGRRRMLLVTPGWESTPGQTLAQIAFGVTSLRQFDTTLRRQLDELLVAANRSGVSVDVVDAMGFEGELDVELSERREAGAWVSTSNRRPAMTTLAEATGGSFLERANSFSVGLETLWRDASDYYSVGITLPGALPDGKVVKVDVSCTRPGVLLRTRSSVGARSDGQAARDLAESALLSPPPASAFRVRLTLGTPRPEGAFSRRRVSQWQLSVPSGELTFAPDGDRRTAIVEVTIAAVDQAGGRSELAPERHTISVPAARLAETAGREVPITGLVRTRPGSHRIVATVRDLASGRTAVVTESLVDE